MSQKNEVTSSFLKIFALMTMLVDHIGAIVVYKLMLNFDLIQLQTLYMFCRIIGRLAFPIFCFLLIEGYKHTRNKYKYAFRLFIFCIISEIPYDLAFNNNILEFKSQNVFFTLFIGFLTMIILEVIYNNINFNKNIVKKSFKVIICLMIIFFNASLADLLHTDYGFWGILSIVCIFTISKKSNFWSVFVTCVLLTIHNPLEMSSFLILIFICLYTGKKGHNIKWFSYLFYPIHLLVLSLIASLI